jgi:hypothetical protein
MAMILDRPAPLAAYVRRSGAVGERRVSSLSADFHGRIRRGLGDASGFGMDRGETVTVVDDLVVLEEW